MEQREECVSLCEDYLEWCQTDPDFWEKIVTRDESWCLAYDLETKWQSSEWVKKLNPPPPLPAKKTVVLEVKSEDYVGPFLRLQMYYPQGIRSSGQTVNKEYYAGVMDHLLKRI